MVNLYTNVVYLRKSDKFPLNDGMDMDLRDMSSSELTSLVDDTRAEIRFRQQEQKRQEKARRRAAQNRQDRIGVVLRRLDEQDLKVIADDPRTSGVNESNYWRRVDELWSLGVSKDEVVELAQDELERRRRERARRRRRRRREEQQEDRPLTDGGVRSHQARARQHGETIQIGGFTIGQEHLVLAVIIFLGAMVSGAIGARAD